jgi:hypothetical protein
MDTFSPRSWFKSVDLPEFGRPMIETKPDLNIGEVFEVVG